jgi:DNA-binding NarL/FixJ family response regulator
VIDAIHRVAAGERYLDPDLGAQLVVADTVPALEPLSDRARDVLELLALGHTNPEIGAKLYVSVRTVDTHRAHIMRKLRLDTRAEMVLFALANGLIGSA